MELVMRAFEQSPFRTWQIEHHVRTRRGYLIFLKNGSQQSALRVLSPASDPLGLLPAWLHSIQLKPMHHPHLLPIMDTFVCREQHTDIAMQHVPRCSGNLMEWVHTMRHATMDDRLRLTYQLLQGMNQLHKNGIVHMHLVPENVLFQNPKHLLVSDHVSLSNTSSIVNAPERMRQQSCGATMAENMWSIGCLICLVMWNNSPLGLDHKTVPMMWETLNQCIGSPSLAWQDKYQLTSRAHVKQIPTWVGEREKEMYRELVEDCLRYDPGERVTCETLLNRGRDKWFAGMHCTDATIRHAPQLSRKRNVDVCRHTWVPTFLTDHGPMMFLTRLLAVYLVDRCTAAEEKHQPDLPYNRQTHACILLACKLACDPAPMTPTPELLQDECDTVNRLKGEFHAHTVLGLSVLLWKRDAHKKLIAYVTHRPANPIAMRNLLS